MTPQKDLQNSSNILYTDGFNFYHYCTGEPDFREGYYSAFYIKNYNNPDYYNCFYSQNNCRFKIPKYIVFGFRIRNEQLGFWLTKSGNPDIFAINEFNKNIYKPIIL